MAIALAAYAGDLAGIAEALEFARKIEEKIADLEEERKNCLDEARKREIDKLIRNLRVENGSLLAKSMAKGLKIGFALAVAGAVCGSSSPL